MKLGMKNKNASASGTKDIPLEDNYTARVVGIVDLDHQPGYTYGEGEVVESQMKYSITYELTSSFTQDGRPHWVSEDVRQSDHEKSTLYKRVRAIDPRGELTNRGENLLGMIGAPCMVNVVYNAKGYPKVSSVTPVPSGYPVPELKNDPIIFSFCEPSVDTFQRLPEFTQNKIKASLNYDGSVLQAMLGEDTNSSMEH